MSRHVQDYTSGLRPKKLTHGIGDNHKMDNLADMLRPKDHFLHPPQL